jgi:hypothetical protein
LEDKDDVPIPKQEKRIQIRFYINYIKGLLKPNEENLIKVRADEIPKLITNLQKPMVKKKTKIKKNLSEHYESVHEINKEVKKKKNKKKTVGEFYKGI